MLNEIVSESDKIDAVFEKMKNNGNGTAEFRHLSADSFKHVIKTLKTNNNVVKNIQTLDLSSNCIGLEQTVRSICDILKNNPKITKVLLGDNHINDKGMEIISEMLITNDSIIEFGLDNNNCTNDGLKFLAKVLKKNKTLQRLYLKRNNIRIDGAIGFCEALETNKTIMEIELTIWHTVAEEEEFRDLLVKMYDYASRNCLSFLNFDWKKPTIKIARHIGPKSMALIIRKVKENSVIESVDLTGSDIHGCGNILTDICRKEGITVSFKIWNHNYIETVWRSIHDGWQYVSDKVQLEQEIDSIIKKNNIVLNNSLIGLTQVIRHSLKKNETNNLQENNSKEPDPGNKLNTQGYNIVQNIVQFFKHNSQKSKPKEPNPFNKLNTTDKVYLYNIAKFFPGVRDAFGNDKKRIDKIYKNILTIK